MSTDIVCTDKQLEDFKHINKQYEDAVEKAVQNNKYAEQIGDLTQEWLENLEAHGLTQEIQNACEMRLPPPAPPSFDDALPYKRMGGRRRRTIKQRKSTKRKHRKYRKYRKSTKGKKRRGKKMGKRMRTKRIHRSRRK